VFFLAATVFSSVVLAVGICGISFASPTATAAATTATTANTAAVHQTVDISIAIGVPGPAAVIHDQCSILPTKCSAKRGQRHVPAENI